MGWSNNHPNGLIHYNPQQAYRGYTLVTNLNSHESRLIDMEGRICHRWHCDQGIAYSYLLPNGNLLLRTGPAGQGSFVPAASGHGDAAPGRSHRVRRHPGA